MNLQNEGSENNLVHNYNYSLKGQQDYSLARDKQQNKSLEVHMAYFRVHSFARSVYLLLSVLYIRAMSGTKGSSGFGSVSKEHIDRRTAIRRKHRSVH